MPLSVFPTRLLRASTEIRERPFSFSDGCQAVMHKKESEERMFHSIENTVCEFIASSLRGWSVVVWLFASLCACADVATVGGVQWSYTVSNGKATIYNSTQTPAIPSETTGAITVPSSLGGYPVTCIGLGAFRACHYLTSITVQSGVTTISAEAFYDSRELSSVKLPEGVTQIGTKAFAHCSKLKSVNIPDSVNSIGEYAFYNCQALMSIHLPSGLTAIQAMTFYSCRSIASFDIPISVTTIGSSAFDDCRGITSITIPPYVDSIGSSAFSWCMYLQEVTIPASVSSIGYNAFNSCDMLETIYTDVGNTGRLQDMLWSANLNPKDVTIIEIEPVSPLSYLDVANARYVPKTIVLKSGNNELNEEAYAVACALYGLTPVSKPANPQLIPDGCKAVPNDARIVQAGEKVVAKDAEIVPDGSIAVTKESIAAPSAGTVKVEDGVVQLGVSVRKTSDLTKEKKEWGLVSLGADDVKVVGGKVVISVPVDSVSGFMVIQTMDTTK